MPRNANQEKCKPGKLGDYIKSAVSDAFDEINRVVPVPPEQRPVVMNILVDTVRDTSLCSVKATTEMIKKAYTSTKPRWPFSVPEEPPEPEPETSE
jgi:hypothetical protein